MNKTDLIAHVSATTGISKRIAALVVDATFDAIVRTVAHGENVTVAGFGTFEPRLRAPRTIRNPQTGSDVRIPAKSVAVFRPGKDFREAVAKG